MTPDWNKAPKWANYAAIDESGIWYWYEDAPIPVQRAHSSYFTCMGHVRRVDCSGFHHWKESIQSRPQPTQEPT